MAMILAAPVTAQGITIAEGDLQDLTVRVLRENNLTAPASVVLENTEFLDIEITGRTVLQEIDTSRPRRASADGLLRVELPGSARLMRYRRDGGLHHGFLWIPANGIASVVVERAGVGASGLDTPFADRIAVAPDGLHAAVPLAGRDLVLLCLESGSRTPDADLATGTPDPHQSVQRLDGAVQTTAGRDRLVQTSRRVLPESLMVGKQAFFVTADERLWRLPLHDESSPEDVTPPPVPDSVLEDEMALSGDGSTLVFLYGPKEQQGLWAIRESGPASPLPTPPSKYEDPGYLPEGEGHPRLLLSDDGTIVLYQDHSVDDETFLLDLSAPSAHHLTADANFEPYIGAVILPFFNAGTVLMAIGDEGQMDWFLADTTPGNIVNLTLTGPDPRPFSPGLLDPENAVLTPVGLLAMETVPSGSLCLRALTPQEPQGVILYDDLTGGMLPGSHYTGFADFLVMTSSGDRLLNGAGAELVAAPAGISLSPPARGPEGKLTLFRASASNGLGAAILLLPDGTLVSSPAETGLEQAVLTSGNGILLNGDTLRYYARGSSTVIPTSRAAVTLVLSGAGS